MTFETTQQPHCARELINTTWLLPSSPPSRLFVLLGPQNAASTSGAVAIPNVLCVLQVAFEGFISQKSIQSEMSRSSKASGKSPLSLLINLLQLLEFIFESINVELCLSLSLPPRPHLNSSNSKSLYSLHIQAIWFLGPSHNNLTTTNLPHYLVRALLE